jgi:TetR/AcrR family transcriptional regulator, transcriptional repressor for nem operon
VQEESALVRYKSGHHDATHTAIVTAASKLLREQGFTATSVATVMGAVGLTPGGFYAHFASKTALLEAAVAEAFVESPQNFSVLARIATEKGDAGFVAEKYLADARVASIATGCPAAALVSELHRQPASVQAAFQAGARATALELAKAPGLQPRSDLGPNLATSAEVAAVADPAAWAALALLMGALGLMRATPDPAVREAIRQQTVAALRTLSEAAPSRVAKPKSKAKSKSRKAL